MSKARIERPTGVRRRTLMMTVAMVTTVAALAVVSPAMATPKGIFSIFATCPTAVPGVTTCQYGQTTSGEMSIGSTKVPILNTITLQGGALPTGKNLNEYFLIPATDGNSLSKTEQNVPGGLLGLVNCTEIKGEGFFEKAIRATCKAIFENKVTGVTATTELVASATNPAILNTGKLAFETGTALVLPVRVHLKNPLLGEECYIGSEAHPLQLQLTTGTTAPPEPNKPISGKFGSIAIEEEKEQELAVITENSLVDNSFSAPVAEGCGGFFSFIINPIINSKIGLPSAGGHNTAILNGTLRSASKAAVLASEKF